MSILGFTIYTVLGTALWNGGHIALGWVLGAQWTLIERYGHIVEVVVLAAIGLGVFWLVWRRWKTRES